MRPTLLLTLATLLAGCPTDPDGETDAGTDTEEATDPGTDPDSDADTDTDADADTDTDTDADTDTDTDTIDPTIPTAERRLYWNDTSIDFRPGDTDLVELPRHTGSHVGAPPADGTLFLETTIDGLTGTYGGRDLHFSFDATTGQGDFGQGVQVQFGYDFDGDGNEDRTDTYEFQALDPIAASLESLNNTRPLTSSGSDWMDYDNGTLTVRLWKTFAPSDDALGADAPAELFVQTGSSYIDLPHGDGSASITLANAGFENEFTGWSVFPENLTNWAVLVEDEAMFPDNAPFVPYAGGRSLKIYGQFTGGPNETPVYQTWTDVTPGVCLTLSGWMWHYVNDPVQAADSQGALYLKFFTPDFSGSDIQQSTPVITVGSETAEWTFTTVTAAVPEGLTTVQAVAQYDHCIGQSDCYTGGAVHFDDIEIQATPGACAAR